MVFLEQRCIFAANEMLGTSGGSQFSEVKVLRRF
jgi:hypothetical protein